MTAKLDKTIRIATATPKIEVTNCHHNTQKIIEVIERPMLGKYSYYACPSYVLQVPQRGFIPADHTNKRRQNRLICTARFFHLPRIG